MFKQTNHPRQKSTQILRIIVIAIGIILSAVCLSLFYLEAYNTGIQLTDKYNQALVEMDEDNFQEAIDILRNLGDFQDSRWFLSEAEEWIEIKSLINAGEYEAAQAKISELKAVADGEKSSEDRIKKAEDSVQMEITLSESYNAAKEFYNKKEYMEALQIFDKLDNYNDSKEMASECRDTLKQLTLSNTISAGVRCSAAIGKNGKVYFAANAFTDKSEIQSWNDKIGRASCRERVSF